jgi:hypothetical protein
MLAVPMTRFPPIYMILIGVGLMVMGWVFPFLMVLRVLRSSWTLNIFSYVAQVAGLFLGVIGAAMYVKLKKK